MVVKYKNILNIIGNMVEKYWNLLSKYQNLVVNDWRHGCEI